MKRSGPKSAPRTRAKRAGQDETIAGEVVAEVEAMLARHVEALREAELRPESEPPTVYRPGA
jgi:hypothetical protein